MYKNITPVILSGGRNSRMGGRNKAFLTVGGKRILDRIIERLTVLFGEILLVTRQPEDYKGFPVTPVTDRLSARSSLTGVHAGLSAAGTDFVFVVPCDAPFLNPAAMRIVLDAVAPELDVVVPAFEDHYEPLFAAYSKKCLPVMEKMLKKGDYKIINLFEVLATEMISPEALKTADPEMLSFFNVNTPNAHEQSEKMVESVGGHWA